MLTFKASFRVSSDTYTLAELNALLGESTKGYSKGEVYSRKNKIREQTLWCLESTVLPTDSFEAHLSNTLDFLADKGDILNQLRSKCEADIFCMFNSDNGQGGAILSPDIMAKLAQYHLRIVFDVYAD
jgi:hypothetical protein